MTTLFKPECKLPNGDIVSVGDVVFAEYYGYVSITKICEIEGSIGIEMAPAPFMFKTTLSHFLGQKGEVKKATPIEVYKFCRENGWDKEKQLIKFK